MCVLSIKVPIRKKSGNLSYAPCTLINTSSPFSSMLAIPLPHSSFDTYCLTTTSLGCNALCMVINLLVLWSIRLSSSLININNVPKYLNWRTAKVFIPLIRFLLFGFVSNNFLVLLRYCFFICFFHLHLFHGISFQYSQIFVVFLSRSVLILF